MNRDVEVQHLDPAQGLTPADLVDLGNALRGAGIIEGRALVAEIQQTAAQVALAIAPKMLDRVRKVQEARIMQMMHEVHLLPNVAGYVNRAAVLRIIATVGASTPTM